MTNFMKISGQYFEISLDPQCLPDNPTIEQVHDYEWIEMQRCLNGTGYNPKDNSIAYKTEMTKKTLERNLKKYLSNPKHTEEEFLNHCQLMLEKNDKLLLGGTKIALQEWLSSHLVLLVNSKKYKSDSKDESKNKTERILSNISNLHRYPEQFFNVSIVGDSTVRSNPIALEIHKSEWGLMGFICDKAPEVTTLNKVDYKEFPIERHLNHYIKKPGNTIKDFVDHVQYMLDNHSNDMKQGLKTIIRGWIDYHYDLIDFPKKEEFIRTQKKIFNSLPDNRTKAYFIHFQVNMNNIPKDKMKEDIRLIERPKYLEYGDKQSYNLYLKIRENEDSEKNKIKCSNNIINAKNIDNATFSYANSYLTQVEIKMTR